MKNLWPENFSQSEHEITPKEFLSRQINFLSDSTKGKLIGTLSTNADHAILDKNTKEDFGINCEVFIHSMKVQAPSLGYSFTLLRLAHSTLKLYPFSVYSNLTSLNYKGNSIDDLEDILTKIFRSNEVVEAITALTSQSEEPLPF